MVGTFLGGDTVGLVQSDTSREDDVWGRSTDDEDDKRKQEGLVATGHVPESRLGLECA